MLARTHVPEHGNVAELADGQRTLYINVQWFRSGLVFEFHRLWAGRGPGYSISEATWDALTKDLLVALTDAGIAVDDIAVASLGDTSPCRGLSVRVSVLVEGPARKKPVSHPGSTSPPPWR